MGCGILNIAYYYIYTAFGVFRRSGGGSAVPLSERKGDIDLIKTVAVFCIVCIHACGNGYYCEYGSPDWMWTIFWGGGQG